MKIYLASRSKARQAILRKLGLRFTLSPVRVKENRPRSAADCPRVVMENALLKARQASAGVKSGLVIGVDTMVCCGQKVYGKPADLKEARRWLKVFSRSAQVVVSGIAVVDASSGKALSAVERTKIYFSRMSDNDIDAYFGKVSPLAMAGGFDIQGLGGLFIRRVEGCYYNVVGLPISKLYSMFKKMGFEVL